MAPTFYSNNNMKAYKATYNFKCKSQEYKVGKTYTSDKMKICSYGIHFCQDMKNVLNYYSFNKDFVLLEIEILGKVETEFDKSVTDKIKVLRVVPFEEYTFKDKLPAFEYDEKGNMISTTYLFGHKYTYEYDDKGNKISETCPDGRKYTYEYDDKGNKISQTCPNGNKLTWEYDEKGNKISETCPYERKYTFKYDEKGNKISQTYPDGDKITWEVALITESDD